MASYDIRGVMSRLFGADNAFFHGASEHAYSAPQQQNAAAPASRQEAAAYPVTAETQGQQPGYSPVYGGGYTQPGTVPVRPVGYSAFTVPGQAGPSVAVPPAAGTPVMQVPVQAPAQSPAVNAQGAVHLPSVYVINVRSVADCRTAINVLQEGNCVNAVMDSIGDPSDVRRYVDMLNGACFSLGCIITRLSARIGVYLLSPRGMAVFTDTVTSQMNAQVKAPQRPQANYAPGYEQQPAARPAGTGESPYAPPQAYAASPFAPPRTRESSPYVQPQPVPENSPQSAAFTEAPNPGFTFPQAAFSARQSNPGYTPDPG